MLTGRARVEVWFNVDQAFTLSSLRALTASGRRSDPVSGLRSLPGLHRARPRTIFPREQKAGGDLRAVQCAIGQCLDRAKNFA